MKEVRKLPPSEPVPGLTLSEVLEALRYLNARGTLCTGCGYRLVEHINQIHSHCTECKRPNVVYSPTSKGSPFERKLAANLGTWVDKYLNG